MFNKKNNKAQVGEAKNQRFLLASISQKMKKGQIAETMTWVVATIVIIVILSFSILISVNIFDDKEFKVERKTDLLATKSLTGFLLAEDSNGKKVFDLIKSDEKINDFEGNLALDIFKKYYQKEGEYRDVWFGINLKGGGYFYRKNDYFGGKPITPRGELLIGGRQSVLLNVELNLEKNLELFLGGENEK